MSSSPPPRVAHGPSSGPVHRTLAKAGNLANLLPTGTVLIFYSLTPTFANGGSCTHNNMIHKILTIILIAFFSLVCFLSSFTDSHVGPTGKLYYGIATPKGLFLFNVGTGDSYSEEEEEEEEEEDLSKYKMRFIDFVHALVSLLVFLVIALSDSSLAKCLFGNTSVTSNDYNALLVNLPIAVGALSTFLFMLFPTTRRGIGYAHHLSTN